ncbi:hypothetical protein V6N11_065988 [Hibiscus sabdariffa]|uniref:Uncharacterized protein n=2 Tax=Hibiscus sabdariffa TaxID=183260 RepID=A0ABR2NUY4_9ROSI
MAISCTYEKPHFPFLLLALLFLFLLLLNPSANPIDSSKPTPAIPFKRLLLHNSSTMDFHSRQRASSSESSRREFGAEAHEVPSGPNPISNREGGKKGIWSAGPKWEKHLSEEL